MNKLNKSLEMYLQSQISKVGSLLKASETSIQHYEEYLKEGTKENTKREISITLSEEIERNEELTFRLNWLIKQIRILEDEMNEDIK